MIRKTQSTYRRRVKTDPGDWRRIPHWHHEVVLRETWWLFFIPLFTTTTVLTTNI